MSEGVYNYSHELIHDASKLMSTYFQKNIHFSRVEQLSEPDRRNLILRLIIENPTTQMPSSLILKQTATEKNVFESGAPAETEQEQLSRFAHDWAGLALLTEIKTDHGPHFYDGSLEHKYMVIEDLGESHPSLVGPLTRKSNAGNVTEAMQALRSYVRRLGHMHADTAGKYNQYLAILNQVYPNALRFSFLPESDASRIEKQLKQLTGYTSKALSVEISSILDFSQSPKDFHVFLHGDICPDNVYYQNNKIQLIDFEWGDFGHALIDASYLRMHMPSCWCSKAVPLAVVEEMEALYRQELIKGVPNAADDIIYNQQLTYACAYWLIRTLKQLNDIGLLENEWICPSGPTDSDSQWDPKKNAFRPRILSRLTAFITCSKTTGHLPKLYEASQLLLTHLKTLWPDTSLIEVFSVFQNNDEGCI